MCTKLEHGNTRHLAAKNRCTDRILTTNNLRPSWLSNRCLVVTKATSVPGTTGQKPPLELHEVLYLTTYILMHERRSSPLPETTRLEKPLSQGDSAELLDDYLRQLTAFRSASSKNNRCSDPQKGLRLRSAAQFVLSCFRAFRYASFALHASLNVNEAQTSSHRSQSWGNKQWSKL